ncbi:ArsR/SmtB family transcription factor [Microbacterium trichothecenolyticum]|uniref:ArsR/SmtB family transcription factor n=1 Tax=Microbacterium trichothecenolyticum TaxID=69370 RepID=UPI0037CAA89B
MLHILLESQRGGRSALPISEIARRAELSRFSASHHLRLLTDAHLVSRVAEGSHRLHSLRMTSFEAIEDWVIAFTSIDM